MPSLRQLVLLLLLAAMEILAGFSVVVGSSILDATSLGYATFWLMLLTAGLSIIVAQAVGAFGPGGRPGAALLLGTGIPVAGIPAWFVSPGPVSFLVACVLLGVGYWRGAALAQEVPGYEQAQSRFGFGFALLFLGIVWVVARGVIYRPAIWHMLALIGIAYTVVAMIALVLARVEGTREPGAAGAVVLAVTLQLGLLVAISVAALQLLSHDLAGWLFTLTRPLWDVVGPLWYTGLTLLFTPIAALIELLRSHAHTAHPYHPPAPVFNPHGNSNKHFVPHRNESPLFTIAGVIFVLGLLTGLAALVWYTFPRIYRYRPQRGYEESRRTDFSMRTLVNGFLRWLRGLQRRTAETATVVAGAAKTRIFGPDLPEDPVRRVYAQLLHRARGMGVAREEGATPLEFQHLLIAVWPEGTADFAAVTSAYVQKRYGDAAFSPFEVEALRSRWTRLLAVMARPEEPVAAAPAPGDPVVAERPPTFWVSVRESPFLREMGMELAGAMVAVVAVFGFIILAVVVAIVMTSR